MSFSSGRGSRPTVTTDPYIANVVCIVHADPISGGNNTTYTDSSSYNTAVARGSGLNQQGSFSPYSPAGYSMSFNGTTDYLTVPYSTTKFDFWTSDFTIEAWVLAKGSSNNPVTFANWYDSANGVPILIGNFNTSGNFYWGFGIDNNGKLMFSSQKTQTVASTNPIFSLSGGFNQWGHIAMVYTVSNSTLSLYANGSFLASGSITNGASSTGSPLSMGGFNTSVSTNYLSGYVSNLRISRTAVYTGTTTYTVPTSKLTPLSSTTLLFNSAQWADSSGYDAQVTVNGTPWLIPYGPNPPTGPYSQVTHGGSLYSGIAADYVGSTAYGMSNTQTWLALGGNDFTIEFWAYPLTSTAAIQYLFSNYSADVSQKGLRIAAYSQVSAGTNGGTLVLNNAGATTPAYTISRPLYQNSWNHFAVTRADGRLLIFQNGQLVSSTPDTYTYNVPAFTIGNMVYTRGTLLAAYTTDLRITKGTAVYTSNFTPPKAPVSADNNDISNRNYYAASFSGSGYSMTFGSNYAFAPVSTLNVTSKFCLEFWVYFNTAPSGAAIINSGTNSRLQVNIGASSITLSNSNYYSLPAVSTGTFNTGQWYHIAIMGDQYTYVAVDGVVTNAGVGGSASYSQNGEWILFASGAVSPSDRFTFGGLNMYARDLRITTGSTVYNTSGFSRPTAPLTSNVSAGTVQFLAFNNSSATLSDNANSTPLTNNGPITFVSLWSTNTSPYQASGSAVVNMNFNNAAIYDAVGKVGLATGVSATTPPTVKTSIAKFGIGSIDFSSSTFLRSPNSPIWDVGYGEFMIDFWVYPTTVTTLQTIFSKKLTTTAFAPIQINITATGKIQLVLSVNGTAALQTLTGATTLTANQWTYVSVHKYNYWDGTFRAASTIGINGTQDGNALLLTTSPLVVNTADVSFGSQTIASSSQQFTGYLGEFRFTKSARGYTTNVPAVPTAVFPKQ